ncbi:hypothetical protein, partial [Neptunomonas phycophila]|uniref:hypothetical protein n=1 Tax=Neptunomonas phycophila TaxID=1572645 RepID=UPI000A9D5B28
DCDSSTQTLNPVCIYQDSTNPNPDPDTPNYSDVISHMNLLHRETKTLFDESHNRLKGIQGSLADGFHNLETKSDDIRDKITRMNTSQDKLVKDLIDKKNPD